MPETEKEKLIKQLKKKMEWWREIVLPANSILLWEKSWHPGLIFAITTTIFLVIYLKEPTILTIFSMSLFFLAVIDYVVFNVLDMFISSSAWNGQKERKLHEICQNLSETIIQIQNIWKLALSARDKHPKVYYPSLFVGLIVLAWLGNIVNNLLLIYLASNIVLLMPGFRHKGRGRSVLKQMYNYVLHLNEKSDILTITEPPFSNDIPKKDL